MRTFEKAAKEFLSLWREDRDLFGFTTYKSEAEQIAEELSKFGIAWHPDPESTTIVFIDNYNELDWESIYWGGTPNAPSQLKLKEYLNILMEIVNNIHKEAKKNELIEEIKNTLKEIKDLKFLEELLEDANNENIKKLIEARLEELEYFEEED
jgi:MinD-like ATPase involved in chromosome partitioning or flagellar assembly